MRTVTAPMRRLTLLLFAGTLALAACGGAGSTPGPTPGPTIMPGPTAGPSGAPALDAGRLGLRIIDQLGERWYCDPDEYPVAHGSELERALERWDEVIADGLVYRAVAARLGMNPAGPFSDAQKQAIYHLWKAVISIPMDPVGNDRYRFDYLAVPLPGNELGTRTAGIIDGTGKITVEAQAPAPEPICPICLARGSRIDTPDGPVAVERLRLGDRIWTIDAEGRRVEGTVIALGSTRAPADHRVIQLTLADGRTVTASPGHPLADGRRLGTLALGDVVDGSPIVALESLPYGAGETFDLVASGATGAYFVDGIPLGTTLLP